VHCKLDPLKRVPEPGVARRPNRGDDVRLGVPKATTAHNTLSMMVSSMPVLSRRTGRLASPFQHFGADTGCVREKRHHKPELGNQEQIRAWSNR